MRNALLSPARWLLAAGVFFLQVSAQAQAPATLDQSFSTSVGANNTVNAITLQPDGKVLIGGMFTAYESTARPTLARLNANGTLDQSFNIGQGANGNMYSIVVQPDGRILAGGNFGSFNGSSGPNLVRLNADGSLDTGFSIGAGLNDYVQVVALQPDGKVLIGGAFTSYNGIPANSIARLNADGTFDASFSTGQGANSTVTSIIVQPDGKILIGGSFILYNGISCRRITRLNADGSLDQTFNPGNGADDIVQDLALQPDGRVVAVGNFINFNTSFRNKIVRLNTDGSVDPSFNPGFGADFPIQSVSLSASKIVIGGNFGYYNGTQRNNLAFLNSDGSADQNFAPGPGPNQIIMATAVQPDGRVLIGGHFTMYSGTSLGYLARVFGPAVTAVPEEVAPAFGLYPNPSAGQITLDLSAVATQGSVTVTVYSLTGQRVWQQVLAPGATQAADLRGIAAGSYEVRVQPEKGLPGSRLLVIR